MMPELNSRDMSLVFMGYKIARQLVLFLFSSVAWRRGGAALLISNFVISNFHFSRTRAAWTEMLVAGEI
jgi:hypothetical protein